MASAYENRLRQIAEEEGMPWEVVRRVVQSEGGLNDPYIRSRGKQGGVQEYSLGPLQLNMRRGVGVEAKKAGFDAASDWEGAYRFGLNWAKKHGWGDWMGARKIGLAGKGGGDGGQYVLRKPGGHVGGAGSGPQYFETPAAGYAAGDTKVASGDIPPLPPVGDKPETGAESLKGGFKDIASAFGDAIQQPRPLNVPMNADMGSGGPMPSFFRPQLMPTSLAAGSGQMGGGGDMRQLLAMLMQQQGGYA